MTNTNKIGALIIGAAVAYYLYDKNNKDVATSTQATLPESNKFTIDTKGTVVDKDGFVISEEVKSVGDDNSLTFTNGYILLPNEVLLDGRLGSNIVAEGVINYYPSEKLIEYNDGSYLDEVSRILYDEDDEIIEDKVRTYNLDGTVTKI